ncbi:hypothetical protein [Patulibacter minatonensis]|uniref:hypothetical protein n=1 Tax=Patulibacter minatonensis TaxID=298163 RepID=UPI00047C34E1|nr:hypothetical protein [Patulibacter minatonensis]
MASPHDQPTRVQPVANPPQPAPAAAGGLDLKTLIITAAASALAAFICSKVWAPGTLASAAFTPVAVALFREALAKPTDVVTSALPAALPLTRRPLAGDPRYDLSAPDEDPTRVHRLPGSEQPTQVTPALGPQGPGATGVDPVTVHAVRQRNRRRWQIAAITGILGFVVAAVLITVPEVIAGKSSTTIFRGGNTPSKKQATPATTTTVIQQVPTDAVTTVTQPTETATTGTTPTTTVTEEAPPTVTETVTTPTTTPTTETAPSTTPGQRSTPGTRAEPDAVDP